MEHEINLEDQDIQEFLRNAFEANYDLLRLEVGRSLAPNIREAAWQQVRLYWEKLQEVAQSVTDTEVRLTLPNQHTRKGRSYSIEGVVDIVREEGYTVMYDIKSLDAEYVRQHADLFERQLNVYAYIWQTLRNEELDETAIIATRFPQRVQDALDSGDEGFLAVALAQWAPIVSLGFEPDRVEETVEEFGEVVDAIEDGRFAPRSPEHLDTQQGATRQRFATAVCNECDARFSCRSYRQWALGGGSRAGHMVRQYFGEVASSDAGREAWREANLEATPDASQLEQDFVE